MPPTPDTKPSVWARRHGPEGRTTGMARPGSAGGRAPGLLGAAVPRVLVPGQGRPGELLVALQVLIDRLLDRPRVPRSEDGDQILVGVLPTLVLLRLRVQRAESDPDVPFGGPPQRGERPDVPLGRRRGEKREMERLMGLVDLVDAHVLPAEGRSLLLEVVEHVGAEHEARAAGDLRLEAVA